MKQMFDIIDNRLLDFETAENPNWHFVSNIDEMKTYLYSQTEVETCWLDLRENCSLIFKLTDEKFRDYWDKEIVPVIQSRLEEAGICRLSERHRSRPAQLLLEYQTYTKISALECRFQSL